MITRATAAILGFVLSVHAATQSSASLDVTLDRGSAYVENLVRQLSSVVAEEHYVQDVHASLGAEHVDLRSDFLFVRAQCDSCWVTFRDVYAVNGHAVRDRDERLARLFFDPAADALERATQITRDGYRYNLGSPQRTVANPLLAVGFLQLDYRDRFDFGLDRRDAARGADVWIIRFKERARPTILHGSDRRDVQTSGRIWIDVPSGRVLQTDLELSTGDRILTTFGYDEALQIDVPLEMRDVAWFNRSPITGIATYSNFRHFKVTTTETFR